MATRPFGHLVEHRSERIARLEPKKSHLSLDEVRREPLPLAELPAVEMVDPDCGHVADRQAEGMEPGSDQPLGEVPELRLEASRLEIGFPTDNEALVEHLTPGMLDQTERDVSPVRPRFDLARAGCP